MAEESTLTLKLFYCYAREDKALRDTLDIHLSNLKRQNYIMTWYDREISAGKEWEREIDTHLNTADIILLLVSPHFMASDYCYGVEMKQALERHRVESALVIPIILRPVDWEDAPFSNLQVLPEDAKPITSWLDQHEAFRDVAKELRKSVKELRIRLYLRQANLLYSQKQYKNALATFEQALSFDSNNAEVLVGKGRALYDLQLFDQAIATFDQARLALNALLVAGSNPQRCLTALSKYTSFLALQGSWTEVLRYTNEALRLAPNDQVWLAGQAQAQAKIHEASQKSQEQTQNRPSSPQKLQGQQSNEGKLEKSADKNETPEGFSSINELFETFFAGAKDAQNSAGSQGGTDIRYELTITFEEAVFGCQKEIMLPRWEPCSHCRGSGAQPGTSMPRCPSCQGTGEIKRKQNSIFGEFVNITMCERCRGEGKLITTPCEKCRGQGRIRNNRRVVVNIPAGVDDGINVRVTGEGEVSPRGGTPGNLYVILTVKSHAFFKRQGNDILYELPISSLQASRGDRINVPTIDGKTTTLRIPPGTESGQSFRLKGMGVPVVHSSTRGDQNVIVKVV